MVRPSTKRRGAIPDPYALALSWLSRRELTERQVRDRLAARGCEGSSIDDAVERLKHERALDDVRTAGAYVRTAVRLKLHGPARLRQDLAARGIDSTVARAAIDEAFHEVDEAALLEKALAKRRRAETPLDERAKARLYRALVAQGFSPGLVRAALRRG